VASNAANANSAGAEANTIGSSGLTSYSVALRSFPSPAASGSPMAMPTAASTAPSRSIMRSTSARSAPSAMRRPISRVRCETTYDLTP
jgi:hypothetical protein